MDSQRGLRFVRKAVQEEGVHSFDHLPENLSHRRLRGRQIEDEERVVACRRWEIENRSSSTLKDIDYRRWSHWRVGGGEGCRLSSALWVYHSRRGKGKGDGEEKGNMGLRGGLIAGGKIKREEET